jgi:phosphinothricin acetyltransferase
MATLHEFAERHVAAANRLTNRYIEQTAVHLALVPATDDAFRNVWISGRIRFPWLAAEVEGAFAGYAKAGVWREREAFGRTCEVGVYVEPAQQGRGVGRALYEGLLPRLREAGFHAVVAAITQPNEASVRLHEAVGFEKAGHFPEVGWKFEHWHDVGFWQLTFR